jgi:hypothetical protein
MSKNLLNLFIDKLGARQRWSQIIKYFIQKESKKLQHRDGRPYISLEF